MNRLSISTDRSGGSWVASYTPWRTTRPQPVTDAQGRPLRFHSRERAENAAYEALVAELNRTEMIHLDPAQVKACPKVWEARSAAGRKRWAEERIRQVMKEIAE